MFESTMKDIMKEILSMFCLFVHSPGCEIQLIKVSSLVDVDDMFARRGTADGQKKFGKGTFRQSAAQIFAVFR